MPAMRDQAEVDCIRRTIQQKLDDRRGSTGVQLTVEQVIADDDGWLHFVVAPARKGVRAYDYAKSLAEVELELRQEGIGEVLLVPSMPD